MTKISAVIISFNNQRTIAQTLASLSWADEIVLVDSGSTDLTLEIAHKYSCKTIYRAFDGYGKQKYFAVSQAKNDWVLVIDADEVCTDEIVKEIDQKIGKEKHMGYLVPISLIFMGRLLRFGGEYKKPHLRLFNKQFGQYNLNEVHEDVEMKEGSIAKLSDHLLHYSYADLHQYFVKFNDYTTRAADQMYKKNKSSSFIYAFMKGTFEFIKLYIFRGLIFDGKQGFSWAFLSSFYTSVKYLKLAEKSIKPRS